MANKIKKESSRVVTEIKRIYSKEKQDTLNRFRTAQYTVSHPIKQGISISKRGLKGTKKAVANRYKKTLINTIATDIPALGKTTLTGAKHIGGIISEKVDDLKNTAKYIVDSKYRDDINSKFVERVNDKASNLYKQTVGKAADKINHVINTPKRWYNKAVDLKDNIVDAKDRVVNTAQNIKSGVGKAVDFTKDTVNKTKDTITKTKDFASKTFEQGKAAHKFIKEKGFKAAKEKAKENISKRTANFNRANIANKFNKAKNDIANSDWAVNSLASFMTNASNRADRVKNNLENKIINFINRFKGIIIFAVKTSFVFSIILVISVSAFAIYGATLSALVGQSPHYYCDVDAPGIIKKRSAYRMYCQVKGGNDGIVEAALSLIETSTEDPQVHTGGYDGTDLYLSAYEQFADMISYNEGDPKNCVTFVDVALAYAGVDEQSIPTRNAASNAEPMKADSNWEYVGEITDLTEDIEPGLVIISSDGDYGHIFIYIGQEKMQEAFPEFDSTVILAEGSWSEDPRYHYGGVGSNYISICDSGCEAFRYVGDLNPRDVN